VNAPTPDALRGALRALSAGDPIAPEAVTAAFDVVMRGEATPAQIAGLLMGLRVLGETSEVVAAVAQSLRSAMLVLTADRPEELVDTCGTGGGSVTTFNISTAAALLAPGRGCASRSTATAPSRRAPAAPMCWRRSGCASTARPRSCAARSTRRGWSSCSRR
jgi:hypothetical protein